MDFLSGLDWGTYYWFLTYPAPVLQPVFLNLAALASPGLLILVALSVLGSLWVLGQPRLALYLGAALLLGSSLAQALQLFIPHPRPDATMDWLNQPQAPPGYPPGNALLAAVVNLTLAGVLAGRVPRRSVRWFLVATAVLLTLLAGLSRLVLGRQFPTDLVGGWLGGLIWALICRGLADRWFPTTSRKATALP